MFRFWYEPGIFEHLYLFEAKKYNLTPFTDECLNGTVAGRKPTGRRNFNVTVYGSNNVTVGPKSKIVHLDPTQRRGIFHEGSSLATHNLHKNVEANTHGPNSELIKKKVFLFV